MRLTIHIPWLKWCDTAMNIVYETKTPRVCEVADHGVVMDLKDTGFILSTALVNTMKLRGLSAVFKVTQEPGSSLWGFCHAGRSWFPLLGDDPGVFTLNYRSVHGSQYDFTDASVKSAQAIEPWREFEQKAFPGLTGGWGSVRVPEDKVVKSLDFTPDGG